MAEASQATPVNTQLTGPAYLQAKFEGGKPWASYLATGTPDQQKGWVGIYDQLALSESQSSLVGGIEREIHVLLVSGIWCGDCIRQGPMIQRIAEANRDKIKVSYLDRDEHRDLQDQLTINAGARVPVAVFASEDFELVQIFGDKPLSRYRILANQQLGAHCPLPGAPVPQDELDSELQDWIDIFERVSLLLRLSGRLREKHGD